MMQPFDERLAAQFHNSVRLKGVIQALIIIDMEGYGSCDASAALLHIASDLIEGISGTLDSACRAEAGAA
ncbi:hypothetical protein [Pararhodobacter marinus]|uniref:hypothetical protein n=1 Tax=Pararhodobacter marinus TaxID=2184063 RepID=UPI0035114C65